MKHPCICIAVVLSTLLGSCSPEPTGPAVTALTNPAGTGSMFPRIVASGSNVILSWLEPAGKGHVLRFADWQDEAWGTPRTLARGDDWFVNWADFPSVVPAGDSRLVAHWLVRKPGSPYAYDVATAVSVDDGAAWTPPRVLHDDDTPTEHGFVSLFPLSGNSPGDESMVRAVWLDGRRTATDAGGMTLRAADLDGQGEVHNPTLMDDLVCDCCQTDATVAATGPVVVYRNRTPDEIRDIHLTRLVDGAWEPDRSVADDGWVIAGCPVNGPAIAADGNRVAVTWYTGAGQPTIRLALSEDSGASFSPPIDIANGPVMGRVDVLVLPDGSSVVSWVQNARAGGAVVAEIRARRIEADGAPGEEFLIARTGAGRPSGFPQMVPVAGRLLVAWTDTTVEPSQVRTALVAPP